jgi:hypothetical protein
LGIVDEGLHEGILFVDQDSEFVQKDWYIYSIPNGDDCRSFRAFQWIHASRTPWMTYRLSVRKVVPTLTSNERRGLSLNGRC